MFFSAALLLTTAYAADNGRAITPPMGWRSWNLFGANVNQALMEKIMDGVASKKRTVDGVQKSLADLGFTDVGLDDNWQACGTGENGTQFHDTNGNPLVNKKVFPDFKEMTDHGHNLGLSVGWYGNNCICLESTTGSEKFYQGDVNALVQYGFDGLKLDGCGAQLDLDLYYNLINATGRPVTIENCHWGYDAKLDFQPTLDYCPFNLYRTSGDVAASYDSVYKNLQTVTKYANAGLSRPGCWAYPDMLEVGVVNGPHGAGGDPGLNAAETRSHFWSWVIVSSPLTLSMDVTNDTIMDAVWPVISNPEVLEVNQAYAGFSGGPFAQNGTISQFFYKPLPDDRMAVLLMNNDVNPQDLTLVLTDVPGIRCARNQQSSCNIRDINLRKDLGSFPGSYTWKQVGAHDAVFVILS